MLRRPNDWTAAKPRAAGPVAAEAPPAQPLRQSPRDGDSPKGADGELTALERGEALLSAAKHGRADEVKRLLTSGVPVDARDRNKNTAMHLACREGHLKCVKKLLGGKAKLTAKNRLGETCLHLVGRRCVCVVCHAHDPVGGQKAARRVLYDGAQGAFT